MPTRECRIRIEAVPVVRDNGDIVRVTASCACARVPSRTEDFNTELATTESELRSLIDAFTTAHDLAVRPSPVIPVEPEDYVLVVFDSTLGYPGEGPSPEGRVTSSNGIICFACTFTKCTIASHYHNRLRNRTNGYAERKARDAKAQQDKNPTSEERNWILCSSPADCKEPSHGHTQQELTQYAQDSTIAHLRKQTAERKIVSAGLMEMAQVEPYIDAPVHPLERKTPPPKMLKQQVKTTPVSVLPSQSMCAPAVYPLDVTPSPAVIPQVISHPTFVGEVKVRTPTDSQETNSEFEYNPPTYDDDLIPIEPIFPPRTAAQILDGLSFTTGGFVGVRTVPVFNPVLHGAITSHFRSIDPVTTDDVPLKILPPLELKDPTRPVTLQRVSKRWIFRYFEDFDDPKSLKYNFSDGKLWDSFSYWLLMQLGGEFTTGRDDEDPFLSNSVELLPSEKKTTRALFTTLRSWYAGEGADLSHLIVSKPTSAKDNRLVNLLTNGYNCSSQGYVYDEIVEFICNSTLYLGKYVFTSRGLVNEFIDNTLGANMALEFAKPAGPLAGREAEFLGNSLLWGNTLAYCANRLTVRGMFAHGGARPRTRLLVQDTKNGNFPSGSHLNRSSGGVPSSSIGRSR